MGAEAFESECRADTATEAFRSCVEQAQYDYGHAGYTGTIAEKDGFVEFFVPDGISSTDFMSAIEAEDVGSLQVMGLSERKAKHACETYDSKWGPAVCVKDEEGTYHFFGWASA